VYVQAYFHISISNMKVLWPLLAATFLEIGLLAVYHATVHQVLIVLIFSMAGLLVVTTGFSWNVLRRKVQPKLAAVPESL
jgi:hypothetical protein